MKKLLSSLLVTAAAFGFTASSAFAGDDDAWQYAAKFVCGGALGVYGPVRPGQYDTAVNVLNPNNDRVAVQVKVSFAEPDHGVTQQSHEIGPFRTREVDCSLIENILNKTRGPGIEFFAKGFFIITSKKELVVTAVYTASTGTGQLTNGCSTYEQCDQTWQTVQICATIDCPTIGSSTLSIDVESIVGREIEIEDEDD